MKKSLDQVLALLPSLSPAERAAVIGRAQALGFAEVRGKRSPVEEVYALLASVVGKGFPPLVRLQKSRTWKSFVTGAEAVTQFVDELFGASLHYRDRKRVMMLLIVCVGENIKAHHDPLEVWRLSAKMSHIWDVVEAAYPGYLEAGLLADALLGKLEKEKSLHGQFN